MSTSFREFATVVCDDMRSATLDAGNVKLTYNALIEKVFKIIRFNKILIFQANIFLKESGFFVHLFLLPYNREVKIDLGLVKK